MRQEKQLLLDEIKDKIKGSNAFIVTRYQTFTAAKARNFRDLLSQVKGDFEVVRKRVFVKAAEAAGFELNVDDYDGHIGVIFSAEDGVEASKVALKFGEGTDKAIEILGGRFDGEYYTGKDVEALARLPGKDEMRAQILSLFEAPMAQTLGVLDALLTSVPHCLENKADKESEQN